MEGRGQASRCRRPRRAGESRCGVLLFTVHRVSLPVSTPERVPSACRRRGGGGGAEARRLRQACLYRQAAAQPRQVRRAGARRAGSPLQHDARQTQSTELSPSLLLRQVLKEGVEAASAQVVDARSAGRFNGTAPEPRAGLRGGHIPNSRNVFFSDVLTPDGGGPPPLCFRPLCSADIGLIFVYQSRVTRPRTGRLKPADELRKIFSGAGLDLSKCALPQSHELNTRALRACGHTRDLC